MRHLFGWLAVSLIVTTAGSATAQVGLDVRPSNTRCVAPPRPVTGTAGVVAFPQTFSAGLQPTAMVRSPLDPTRWWVSLKAGLLRTVVWDPSHPATPVVTTALDLTDRIVVGIEAGLTGMAFHPGFPLVPYVYVHYSGPNPPGVTGTFTERISRFTSRDGVTFDRTTEVVLMTLPEMTPFHHAGKLAFGPDGDLYLGFGDGGPGLGANAQDLRSWYGKILRIDVDHGTPYAIPPDNPLASGGGAPELFAWGLRNPYQLSFDATTGELWVGDVGLDTWEEVDRVVRGGNYGWPILEGDHCLTDPCDGSPYVPPVAEHLHADIGGDSLAIIGGYVYRGTAIPELAGRYVYGDWNGNVWALMDDGTGNLLPELLANGLGEITGFGEDADGELSGLTPALRQIEHATAPPPAAFPQTLSATGCRSATDVTQPAAGVIPYAVNVPLWSDGAEKSRWMGVPDGGTIDVGADGDWNFPIGTVMMKDFVFQGRLVETRLFMRHRDGGWAGYSYAWNAAGTDANLLTGEATAVVGGQTWHYPSRTQCLACHTVIAGSTLGPTTAQLNRTFFYPSTGRLANQLDTLSAIGMLSAPLPAPSSQLPILPGPDTPNQPLALRARGYLQANCAHCHAPGGPTEAAMDLRYTTLDADTNVCGIPPALGDLGVAGALIVAPGDPSHSILSLRMHALDAHRMPPLATFVVDPAGTQLIDGWISSLTGCAGGLPGTTTTTSTTITTTTRLTTTSTTTSTTRATTSNTASSTTSTTTTPVTSTTGTTIPTGAPTTTIFRSIGDEDGTLIEWPAQSGVGGVMIPIALGLNVGDQPTGAQTRAILSFDTSGIPDDATIVSAFVRIQRIAIRGHNPFRILGSLVVDVQDGSFGDDPELDPSDFQAPATAPMAGTLSVPLTNGAWSWAALAPAGLAAINKSGRTQLRLRFTVHDSGIGIGDRVVFGAGDQTMVQLRPRLIVGWVH